MSLTPVYKEETEGVEVIVEPYYVEEQSQPQARYYCYAYKVKLVNRGSKKAQLIARHWIITDGSGKVEEVKGPGVVGETPMLDPGQSFEYTSFCPLTTPTGNMRGWYHMVDEAGRHFDIRIPVFFLRDNRLLN